MQWNFAGVMAAIVWFAGADLAGAQVLVKERVNLDWDTQAVGADFMGVQLGGHLPDECPAERPTHLAHLYNMRSADGPCWMATNGRPGSEMPPRDINELPLLVPSRKRPDGTRTVTALVISGRVEGLRVTTDGFVHQERLLEQLVQKFGEPRSQEDREVTAGSGGRFDAVRATWRTPNLHVLYSGMAGRIDEGIISVFTDVGARQAEDRAAAQQTSF